MEVSVPSYVIPGSYVENLRWLRDNSAIRRVELLFFIYDDDTRAILRRELEELKSFSKEFRFTAHLPDEVASGHEELLERIDNIVEAYVVHPPRRDESLAPFASLVDDWRSRFGADRFRLENTKLDRFYPADKALSEGRPGPPRLCADLGHLVLEGFDPAAWAKERLDRIDELHIHGCRGGKDHQPFDGSESWFTGLDTLLKNFGGLVELELFSWEELKPGLKALEPYLKERPCRP